jgi:hypothetical protein
MLDGAANSSPPPCGEGSGVGVVPWGTVVIQRLDPPPQPSPTRGEGVHAALHNFTQRLLREVRHAA